MTWPEEYVPSADCGHQHCHRCRAEPTPQQLLAEHRRRLKAGELVDTIDYPPDEPHGYSRVISAEKRQSHPGYR